MKHLNIYKVFDVVTIPFPFSDSLSHSKLRPVVILSSQDKFNSQARSCVVAMITSSNVNQWPLDTDISDLSSAGLKKSSFIRMKLFTLDLGLIYRRIGHLSLQDQISLKASWKSLFGQLV